jgi:transcription antitermination factor NusG
MNSAQEGSNTSAFPQNHHLFSSGQPWYGVRTRSNFERVVSGILDGKGFENYFPTYRSRRKWSDRTIDAEAPLFPGYVFCRFDKRKKVPILSTPGVVGIVGFGKDPAEIAEEEIATIQSVLAAGLEVMPYPFLREGETVRIIRGSLEGIEGLLLKKKTDCRLVVSVTMLQRSISVEIDSDSIEAVRR